MRLALKGVGLSYKDIQAVTVGGAPACNAAVITGRLDFTVATDWEKIEGEKAGLKVIIDIAKLKIPFQFSCTVTTGRMIRQNPDVVRSMVKAMAEAVHYYKTQKEDAIKIMQNIHVDRIGRPWREPTLPTGSFWSRMSIPHWKDLKIPWRSKRHLIPKPQRPK